MARSARPPRDYIRALADFMASGERNPGRQIYLARMAGRQTRAEALGQPFVPQAARGHRPQEHRTPARLATRERQRLETIRERQDRFFAQIAQRLSGPEMIRQEERWAALDLDHRQRIIDARRYALAHRGVHSWSWYQEEYGLDDDDIGLFGYD